MEFPHDLKVAIDTYVSQFGMQVLRESARALSEKYRNSNGSGKKLLTERSEALAYAIVRMPATFGAVSGALRYSCERFDKKIETVLDVGAGTGAASWAVAEIFSTAQYVCLEREPVMRELGQKLMQANSHMQKNVTWPCGDLTSSDNLKKCDLVVSSYVLNELREEERCAAINKLWQATKSMLLIVEPGTPNGFEVIKQIRGTLLQEGAHIAAPCPHEERCRIVGEDWCHFSSRVQRGKVHKALKGADVPYEDEKFTYIAFVRNALPRVAARIMRHPYIGKGVVKLEVCGRESNETLTVTKKIAELFKIARKAQCGDGFYAEAMVDKEFKLSKHSQI